MTSLMRAELNYELNNIWIFIVVYSLVLSVAILYFEPVFLCLLIVLPSVFLMLKRETIYFIVAFIFTIEVFCRYYNFLPKNIVWLTDIFLPILIVTNFSIAKITKVSKKVFLFFCIFILTSIISIIINECLSWLTVVGLRRAIFPFLLYWALLMTISTTQDLNRLHKLVYKIVLAQPVFCLVEFVIMLAFRNSVKGMMSDGYLPIVIDSACGTFGHGSTGTLGIFLLMYIPFLFFYEKENNIEFNVRKYLYISSPLFIIFSGGSFALLPVMLLLILLLSGHKIHKIFFVYIPVTLAYLLVVFQGATFLIEQTGTTLQISNQFESMISKLSITSLVHGASERKGVFVDHVGSIIIATRMASRSEGGIWFGMGPGMVSDTSITKNSSTSEYFKNRFSNQIASSNFFARSLSEYGVVGVLCIVVFCLSYMIPIKISSLSNINRGLLISVSIFLASFGYVEGWMNRQLVTIFVIIVFTVDFYENISNKTGIASPS
jgi:hypothetical protein